MPAANLPMATYSVLINKPTQVRVNGNLLNNLVNGSYYEFKSDKVCKIVALSPVQVAQYLTSQNECTNTGNGTNGDPEMTYLFPFDYSLSRVTLNLPQNANITSNYLNVVLKTAVVDSFR